MATSRKVIRAGANGKPLIRYQVRWIDKDGKRRSRKFKTAAAANTKLAQVSYRLDMGMAAEGIEAGCVLEGVKAWLDHFEGLYKAGKRERSTYEQYERHMRLHIGPAPVAALPLKTLSPPDCQAFAWHLERALSVPMARTVWRSFCDAMAHCVAAGLLASNPTAEIGIKAGDRKLLRGEDADAQERAVIPEMADIRLIFEKAQEMEAEDDGRALAYMALLTFAGMRSSEARGVGISHFSLFGASPEVKIRQRADEWGKLGPPKSKKGYRTIPLGAMAAAALRKWLSRATAAGVDLAFCTENGKPYSYSHLYRHLIVPLMIRANMVTWRPKSDGEGKIVVRKGGDHFAGPYCPLVPRPRYSPHDFRHVFASLWIDQGADPKRIQALMGHSSITTTMNLYGHLWAKKQQSADLARAAEAAVLSAKRASK